MGWATFWANFSQIHLVKLLTIAVLLDECRDDDEDEEGEHEVAEGQHALDPI
jgi:hypothetical protein